MQMRGREQKIHLMKSKESSHGFSTLLAAIAFLSIIGLLTYLFVNSALKG